MTASPLAWSSAAVGSSHTTRRGSWMSARAMATRCCSPPDSWRGGRRCGCRDRGGRAAPWPFDRLLRPPGRQERHGDVLRGGQRRQQVVLLEHEAEVLAPEENPLRSRDRPWSPRIQLAARRRSSPAMTEISVVLPQPLGPTRKVSSPKRASKSTPRSASMRASPSPKCFFDGLAGTASIVFHRRSSSEDRGRLEHEHAADAQEAGDDHHEQDAGAREGDVLPHQHDAARARSWRVISKKVAAMPVPMAKPSRRGWRPAAGPSRSAGSS